LFLSVKEADAQTFPVPVGFPRGQSRMETVFRAAYTKLNRDIALKILPEPFASYS